jgi:hypothetical protein
MSLLAFDATFRDTFRAMAIAISVRLDDEAERALRALQATGFSQSEAVRAALLEAARLARRAEQVAAEAAALEADPADRAEALAVASLMESVRAAG